MRTQQGFSLIELLIVIAIIGILSAIAAPFYQNYTARAQFSEVIAATNPFKAAVEACIQIRGIANCDTAGTNGIPPDASANGNNVQSVAVGTGGRITATATNANGLNGRTYILEPSVGASGVTWAASGGTCSAAGLC